MNIAQRSFVLGELSPSLYARTDLAAYGRGLRTLRNFVIQRSGGVTNRAGTRFVRAAKDSTNTLRLIDYVEADDVAYVLEFGNQTIRFVRNRAHVEVAEADLAAWADTTAYVVGDLVRTGLGSAGTLKVFYCIEAHTSVAATDEPGVGTAWQTKWHQMTSLILSAIYEIPSPYTSSDLSELQYVQSENVVYLVHPDFAPRQLTRVSETEWILELVAFGPSIDGPTGIAATGGDGTVADTFWAITTIAEETFEESEPTLFDETTVVPKTATPTTLTWNLVSGAREYAVYRSPDGGRSYGFVGFGSSVPVEQTDTTWTDASESVITATSGVTSTGGGQCVNPLAAISATNRAHDGFYAVRGRLTITSNGFVSGTITARALAYYSRDSEARVFAGIVGEFTVPVGSGVNNFDQDITVPDNGYTTLQIEVVPEILAIGTFTDAAATLTFTVSPNDAIAWDSQTPGFVDNGEAPDMASRPPVQPALFNAPGRYPGTVGFYQQRLIFARSDDARAKVWGSQSALPLNFSTSTPLLESDAVTFSLVAKRMNEVRHVIDLDVMLVGTNQGWWRISGNTAGTLVPGETNPRRITARGSANHPAPVEVGETVLFVQARQTIVRDLLRTELDGTHGKDLTIFSAHLFDGYTIADWAYQETPHSVLWLVRSDGVLLSLTYLPEADIWGWARHDTQGLVENVCVIPEGTEDALYLVVQRPIEGVPLRYIERMAPRSFDAIEDAVFMDSAVTYDGVATTTITGLDHLEGESVSVLADGDVVASPNNPQFTSPLTVSGGAITLPEAASKVQVGLPYVSDLTTLDIDTPSGPSLKPDRKFIVQRVTLMLEATRGLWIGTTEPTSDAIDPTRFYEPKMRQLEAWDAPTDTLTGPLEVKTSGKFNDNARITVRQADPLPATILAAMPTGGI